jgi:hypothetical protein
MPFDEATYDCNVTADGFELVEDFDIRSGRTFDRAAKECEELERWYPACEFELRFAWGFSFGRPGVPPGMVPQIQIWCRSR